MAYKNQDTFCLFVVNLLFCSTLFFFSLFLHLAFFLHDVNGRLCEHPACRTCKLQSNGSE